MKIIALSEDNIASYSSFTGPDMAENIGRSHYQGLVAREDMMFMGGMIWQYKKTGDATESLIEWFSVADRPTAELLFAAYKEQVDKEGVTESTITIPALESPEQKEILKEAGFRVRITESDNIIVTLSELSAMPLMKDRKIPKQVLPVGEITVRQLKRGIDRCAFSGRRGLCEDLNNLPISAFEPDVSTCYLDSEGEVAGLLLFHMLPSQMLSIQLMICLDKDVAVALPGMMRLFVTRMEEKYPPDTKILLNRHNEVSLLLSEKLLPRGFGIPVYRGKRTEETKGGADG